MPNTLMSFGTGGLWSNSGSWRLCDPIAEWDSENTTTNLTTSYVTGAAFMPGIVTYDALAIKPQTIGWDLGNITTSLITTGAFSGITLTGTQITLGLSDIATGIGAVAAPDYGWLLFRFTGNFTTQPDLNYYVQCKAITTAGRALYRSGAAGNWARQLRTTSGQAPATGDKLIIVGEYSGSGSGQQSKIIMDVNNSGSGYGSIWISRSGILEWATGNNTYLNITGSLVDGTRRGIEVCASGTMNVGTSGAPIPSGVTGIIEFGVTSNVQFGLEVRKGGFLNIWGN